MSGNCNIALVNECIKKTPWDLGNKVLYDLCANYFTHITDEEIIAKVWLIGRSYAAAIERRKEILEDINDDFYKLTVVNAFMNSEIDGYLKKISLFSLNIESIPSILKTHKYLIERVFDITKLEKRSFSSKYLHFHLPNLFFLYDSRAMSSLRQFKLKLSNEMENIIEMGSVDKEYGRFFCKCYLLQQNILQETGTLLSPRQLDNLLIYIANAKIKIINHQ
ncbi:MAG: hypothetical protein Q8T04_18635 [Bacteroidota bacterium]|nr:hypothetical protein [Bacteroidota bacterium]